MRGAVATPFSLVSHSIPSLCTTTSVPPRHSLLLVIVRGVVPPTLTRTYLTRLCQARSGSRRSCGCVARGRCRVCSWYGLVPVARSWHSNSCYWRTNTTGACVMRARRAVVRCCRRCQGRSHTLGRRQRMAVKVDGEPPAWLEAGDYANCGYDLFLSKVGKDARHNAGVA